MDAGELAAETGVEEAKADAGLKALAPGLLSALDRQAGQIESDEAAIVQLVHHRVLRNQRDPEPRHHRLLDRLVRRHGGDVIDPALADPVEKPAHQDAGAGTLFAGDSRNDLDPLLSAARGIVVANARPALLEALGPHRDGPRADTIYLADRPHLHGVLEGCRRFGLVP